MKTVYKLPSVYKVFVTSIALFLFLVLPTLRASAQVAAGAVTVGVALNQLMNQVQAAIEGARNAGLSIEMQAGTEAALAIQNEQNVYKESLNLTIDKADLSVAKSINQLKGMVDDVTNRTFQNLDVLTLRAQTIVNSLPFRKHQPQVNQTTPCSIVPTNKDTPLKIDFIGNFEFASNPAFSPKLILNGKSYNMSSNTTENLTFIVPSTDLFPIIIKHINMGFLHNVPIPFVTPIKSVSYVTGSLEIPWQSTSFLGLINKREVDNYKIILATLPSVPGSISLVVTSQSTTRIPKRRTTDPPFYQSSAVDGQNNDHPNVPYQVVAESGWHIVPGTSHFNTGNPNTGVWSQSLVTDAGDRIVYNVTTIHKQLGTSGQIQFSFSFDEYQDITVNNTTTTELNLGWGDSQVINYPLGSWKIIYKSYDGTSEEFAGVSSSNPHIKLVDQGGTMAIVIPDSKEVACKQ